MKNAPGQSLGREKAGLQVLEVKFQGRSGCVIDEVKGGVSKGLGKKGNVWGFSAPIPDFDLDCFLGI